MRLCVAVLLSAMVVACGRDRRATIGPAPERELPRTPPAPPREELPIVTTLVGHAGDEVIIEGRLLDAAKPRITTSVPGKSVTVVDVDGSHLHVVTYLEALPDCVDVRMSGKVIVAAGEIASGGTHGAYAEPQLDVASVRCR